MSKLTADILNKYGVTYWDPCLEKCIGGKCGDPNTVGCCPVIRTTPLSFVPEASGNSIRSEFVTGSDGNIYYIDKAGVSVLLNKRTIMDNLIAGHPIGRYTNERGETFVINETVTYIGEMTLDGTVLHVPFVNEAGIVEDNQVNLQSLIVNPPAQTPIFPVDTYSINMTASGPYNTHINADIILDQISGGGNNAATITVNGLYVDPLSGSGGSSYTALNGLNTASYVHRLGGNLINDTSINGQNAHYLNIDNPLSFQVINTLTTDLSTILSLDSTDSQNNEWYVKDVQNNVYTTISLSPTTYTSVSSLEATTGNITELKMGQGIYSQLYTGTSSAASWLSTNSSRVAIGVQNSSINFSDPSAKIFGISTGKHYQRNMTTGYSGYVINTQGNSGNSENDIKRCLTGSSLGTISYPSANTTSTQETGVLMFTNSTPITNTLPAASIMPNKVLEIRAFGTSTVTLSPAPKLNTTGATLSTLQPIGSNDYSNPTYVKIISNGIDWLVINQW